LHAAIGRVARPLTARSPAGERLPGHRVAVCGAGIDRFATMYYRAPERLFLCLVFLQLGGCASLARYPDNPPEIPG